MTLEPRVMMTKTRAWALDAETAPVAPLPSASVLPVPSTAHQLLMRCQALLIQLLHNGWRYQEQSAIGQAECWRMTSPRSVFIGWHMCWHNFVIQKARHG